MATEPPLISLRDAAVTFGGAPLFSGIDIELRRGERACLVGRNGSGKSTMLRLLAGDVEPDAGTRFLQPGIAVAYLPQQPMDAAGETVMSHVAGGLEPAAESHAASAALERLKLDGARPLTELSGGERRRADLARALAGAPDLLLLDEPTNHLDLPTIAWLEETLGRHRAGILVVSHDRAFLRAVSRRTLWLDRGAVRSHLKGYADFDAWSADVMAAEDKALSRLDTAIAADTRWLHKGITARRRRNQGRLRRLQAMRAERREWLATAGRANLAAVSGGRRSTLVAAAESVNVHLGGRPVLTDVSVRLRRGDRLGIIGANGAGKTTLLSVLTGERTPDTGDVRLARNLDTAVFDQRRTQVPPTETLRQVLCPSGGDVVDVHGAARHVVAYLKDFLFDPRQVDSPVGSLSGGERSRLLLARLLARPVDLLALDEPTNDLDMDTLDLLADVLGDYDGTLILVSHDRDFLDRLVTSVIALEGDGRATEYAGGYSDYLVQRGDSPLAARPASGRVAGKSPKRTRTRTKLGYLDQRELDGLPDRIEQLHRDIAAAESVLDDPALFQNDNRRYLATAERLARLKEERDAAEARWLDLEGRREALGQAGPGDPAAAG